MLTHSDMIVLDTIKDKYQKYLRFEENLKDPDFEPYVKYIKEMMEQDIGEINTVLRANLINKEEAYEYMKNPS
jgi:hypothetical protein